MSMEARFKRSLLDLQSYVEQRCKENQKMYGVSQFNDKIVANLREDRVVFRVRLQNNGALKDGLVKVMEDLIIPYTILVDGGFSCRRSDRSETHIRPSRNSALPLKQLIIRESSDIDFFLDEIGYSRTGDATDAKFERMIKENTDDRFGFFTRSSFSFLELNYMEVYVDSNTQLVKAWQTSD